MIQAAIHRSCSDPALDDFDFGADALCRLDAPQIVTDLGLLSEKRVITETLARTVRVVEKLADDGPTLSSEHQDLCRVGHHGIPAAVGIPEWHHAVRD